MIISYKHNFIFVKTRKVAGSSMEMALTHCTGPDDIVTTLALPDEFHRHDSNPDALARNFSDDPAAEEVYRDAVRRRLKGAEWKAAKLKYEQIRFYNHMKAVKAKRRLGDDAFWEKAFKFTMERHPYEKAVSLAWMHTPRDGVIDDVLDEVVEKGHYRNYQLYTDDDGAVMVDYFIRHEALADGVRHVEQMIGVPDIYAKMPRAKGKYRKDTRTARQILRRRHRRKIQEFCAREFDLLGYEP